MSPSCSFSSQNAQMEKQDAAMATFEPERNVTSISSFSVLFTLSIISILTKHYFSKCQLQQIQTLQYYKDNVLFLRYNELHHTYTLSLRNMVKITMNWNQIIYLLHCLQQNILKYKLYISKNNQSLQRHISEASHKFKFIIDYFLHFYQAERTVPDDGFD